MAESTVLERCRLNEPRNWPSGLGPDGLCLRKRPGVMDTQPQTVGLSGSQALRLDFRPRGPHPPPRLGSPLPQVSPARRLYLGRSGSKVSKVPTLLGRGLGPGGSQELLSAFASGSLGACPELLLVTWFLAPEPSPPHAPDWPWYLVERMPHT